MAMMISIPTEHGFEQVPFIKETNLWGLIRKTYERIELVLVHNQDNSIIEIFPVLESTQHQVPYAAMLANRMEVMNTGKKWGELDVSAITEDFWTCKCPRNYAHHKVEWTCQKCGLTVNEETYRYPYLSKLFKLDLIVE